MMQLVNSLLLLGNKDASALTTASLALLLLSSCSHQSRLAATMHLWPCITDDEAELVLPIFENLANASGSTASSRTELRESSCRRRVYERNGQTFVVSKSWGSVEGSGGSGNPPPPRTLEQARSCLEKAVSDIKRLNSSDGVAILDAYRARFPDRWNDPEHGPVMWLDCSKGEGPTYYDSLVTMLHESTHTLRSENCLFIPSVTGSTCLDFKGSLPSPAIAQIDSFPVKNPDVQSWLQVIQKTYLVEATSLNVSLGADPAVIFFDELNAYTVTTETDTAILRGGGVAALDMDQNFRPLVMLQLFMVYVARYLDEIRQMDPTVYKENLSSHTENRRVVDLLLNRATVAYKAWVDELKKNGKPELEFEQSLWREYQLNQTSLQNRR